MFKTRTLKVTMILIYMMYFFGFCLLSIAKAENKQIIIGSKNFTEQYILVNLAKELLEKHNFNVRCKLGVGTVIARKSLLSGQIDMYFEYTGTAYTVFYKQKDPNIMSIPLKVYNWVKEKDEKKGLIWLNPIKFNNTYTIMLRHDQSEKLSIQNISDFAAYVNNNPKELIIALEAEFWERPDGFKKMMGVYGFSLPIANIKKMDMGLTYMALTKGQVDAAMGYATDGRVIAYDLINLVDDKQFFPVYNPAAVIRKELLIKYPEIKNILYPLAEKLTTSAIQHLNTAVDIEHKEVVQVSKNWLIKNGLL